MIPSWTKKRWLKFPLGAWFLICFGFLLAAAVYSILFVRRTEADYKVNNRFSVRDPAFFGSALSLANPIPFEGNRIELLHNGAQSFPSMLEAIRGAKTTVNFEAFLFNSGEVASQFCAALAERARAGVIVRVLLDGLGSGIGLDNKDVDALKKAGCRFLYYHPMKSWRVDQLNRRTHRRVLVIDGRVGFTGGIGFADQWMGNADSKNHWRDIHARLEGPIVSGLQSAFQSHWIKSGGDSLTGPNEFPVLPEAGPLKAQVVASESFSIAPFAMLKAVAFSAAEKSIWITNSYCAPSDTEVEMLVAAVRRGVVVNLILPGKHNDQPLTKAAGRTAYGNLLKGGVQIFEYEPTMIHTKTFVVDGLFSVFGTSNFDARSSLINEEIDVAVYDQKFAGQMEAVFAQDLEKCKPYTLKDFEKRSLWERFTEFIVMPFHSHM